VDEQATEAAILEAMDRLNETSEPGDSLIIYFSGHGTSAQDSSMGAQLHLPDGSGAIVAYDFNPDEFVAGEAIDQDNHEDGLLIGRYDMRPRFEALDQDRTVLVMFDSCFAGNTARSLDSEYTPKTKRFVSLDNTSRSRGASTPVIEDCDNCAEQLHHEYPYDNVVYFGAAAEHELAVDISQAEINAGLATSFDGKPHGAFTDALLRALVASTKTTQGVSYRNLFQRTLRQFQTHCEACGHTPVMLPSSVLTELAVVNLPIFPGLSSSTTLAANESDEDDAVVSAENTFSDAPEELLVASADTLANTPWLNRYVTRRLGTLSGAGSSIVLNQTDDGLEARSSDGQLIHTLDGDEEETLEWVTSRAALIDRLKSDQLNTDALPVELGHPLHGSSFYFGENLTFSARVDAPSRLLVLALDTAGSLNLIYPSVKQEWEAVIPAGRTVTLPAAGAPDLRVTAPAGTDEILFYALPEDHPSWVDQPWLSFKEAPVNFTWLDAIIAQSPTRVSAAHRRLIAVAP